MAALTLSGLYGPAAVLLSSLRAIPISGDTIMLQSKPFGELSITAFATIDSYNGIGHRSSMWQILEAFTRETEGEASRVAFGTSGAIILTTIPGDPNSGAFYLYDKITKTFLALNFEKTDNFNVSWFDLVMTTYDLQELIYRKPEVEKKPVQSAGHGRRHRRRRHGRRNLDQGFAETAQVA
jgi:hypothetical protein